MSELGWIDFSPDDRNKVSTILSMMAEKGTLDELGIGRIRDAYSDALFPGISTIQTRAKYFIIIPRIFRDYQELTSAKKRRYKDLQSYLKERENEVAKVLATVHSEDVTGIIGRTRIDTGGVDRRPSVIYWNGLRKFGIVKTELSFSDFCRDLECSDTASENKLVENEDGADDNHVLKTRGVVSLPGGHSNDSNDWFSEKKLSIYLSLEEANFLKEIFSNKEAIANSVLAQLFKNNLVNKALSDIGNEKVADFDVLTDLLTTNSKVSEQCKKTIILANEFSLAMEGPHIRFNFLLARNNKNELKVEEYDQAFKDWKEDVTQKKLFKAGCAERWLSGYDHSFARLGNSKAGTFVKKVCELMQSNGSVEQLDKLIEKRALDNKPGNSLLLKKVEIKEWIGIQRLNYRWGTAKNILQDIQDGLHA